MVNTVRLSAVVLATLINLAVVATREEVLGLDTAVSAANNTELISEEDFDFDYDYGSSIEERKKCFRTKKCKDSGGYCIKSSDSCVGTEDLKSCKGKKCKCCIPIKPTCPPCPTVPACPTGGVSTTTAAVPAGFELFDGRVIRRTKMSDAKSISYDTSMKFCDQFGAKPFIPLKANDYLLYKTVRTSLTQNGYMWLPANDRVTEGTLRWYNGDMAKNINLWEWHQGKDLALNGPSRDCLFYGTGSGGPGTNTGGRIVHMLGCVSLTAYPPICEII